MYLTSSSRCVVHSNITFLQLYADSLWFSCTRFSLCVWLWGTGVMTGHGGPFGAVIVEANTGKIIARGCNKVLLTKDPTAHAEVVAIREACAKLNRFSLHDCVIYASCQPCPMCLSAIVWAKLPHCIYSALPDDAAQAGFDDRFLYDYIQGKTVTQKLILTHAPHPQSGKPFAAYSDALRQNRSGRY